MSTKSTSKNSQNNSLDLKELKGTPTLVISSELQQYIDWLHMKTGSKEWSGPLIYRALRGDINNPDELCLRAEGIFLMDVGTSGGTDFEMSGEETVALYDSFPDLQSGECRIGLIHTHHDMRTYFSTVDTGELKDNAEDYNAYLSLIVGFNMKPVARIAFVSEVEEVKTTSFAYRNMKDEVLQGSNEQTESKKVIYYYDCDVQIEFDHIEDGMRDRYDLIKERSEKQRKNKHKKWNQNKIPGYNQGYYGKRDWGKKEKKNDYKYSIEEVEFFLCKLCSFNPNSNTRHFSAMLKTLDRTNATVKYLNATNLFNIIDDCVSAVFSKLEENQMDIQDRYDLFEECVEYLETSINNKKSLVEKYNTAKQVNKALKDIMNLLIKSEEEEDEFTWY